ncbi:hypothetical protein H6A61_03590 [Bacteroides caecigallinarum]|uniref:hypothetical protein n=1 Tax=Bacteroides caecigallinarum TaxID=1411144 RepID=UPI00195BF3BD|nr:hypothetical protein [Bacteroides caecigallinarum]MBM6959938.1 hypothetical protein [Bacteroides caecigallinarum]
MKKTKFAVLLTAFMAVLGLSSCLGEPDPYNTVTEIMRVQGFMPLYSFKSSAGYSVEPTNSSVFNSNIDANFAWVTYKYDTRTTVINENNKTIDAEIQYLLPINEIEPGYGAMEANAAMFAVSESVKFYDKTNIFIDLTYYYESSNDQDDLTEELGKHDFYLTKATAEEDEDVTDDTMVLFLTHMVADADNNEDRKAKGTETRHFDLNYLLQGSVPEKILIKFKQNSSSIEAGDKADDSKIEIEYKSIIDTYFNNNSSL